MSFSQTHAERTRRTVVSEPDRTQRDDRVVDGAAVVEASAAWLRLKDAAIALQELQEQDGSVPEDKPRAGELIDTIVSSIAELAPLFPHDGAYLQASIRDFERWKADGFGVPDFYDSLVAFHPEQHRIDGLRHLIVFPMYTQNGSRNRYVEALIAEVIWPAFIAALEAGDYSNKLFVSLRLIDFTPGYDTNSAVLFPETVAMREVPAFTWGAIFQDREAARFRRVVRAASAITKLDVSSGAQRLLDDQRLAEETFVMWDMIHDRTHMRGDLPFDPFMIKQRMPYFLYSLEEMRCDMTAFREAVAIQKRLETPDDLSVVEHEILDHAQLVQDAVIFDRIFRFPLTGTRVRNYDGLGGQLLFAWLHQRGVLHWTDTSLSFEWGPASGGSDQRASDESRGRGEGPASGGSDQRASDESRGRGEGPASGGSDQRASDESRGRGEGPASGGSDQRASDESRGRGEADVPSAVVALGDAIDELYWHSIDRPKTAHWLAAYELVRSVLDPNPASLWARGLPDEVLAGAPKGYTDAVLDDEFPLSMFYEALQKKMADVIASTSGIRATA